MVTGEATAEQATYAARSARRTAAANTPEFPRLHVNTM